MFKNKVKLAKKLAILLTFGTAAVAATQNSAFAMGSTHTKKHHHHHHHKSAKKPAVFEIEICRSSNEEELIAQTQAAMDKKMKTNVSLSTVCGFKKFKFARFLIENHLVDTNENLYLEIGLTPLAASISGNILYPIDSSDIEFIKDLVDKYGADVDGMHEHADALIHAFSIYACSSRFMSSKLTPEKISTLAKNITEAFDYLLSKGMDINGVDENGHTIRYHMEYEAKNHSAFYQLIYQRVVKNGGKLYI